VKAHKVVRRRGSHIFSIDRRLTDGGKVVSLTHRPPFTPREIDYVLICVYRSFFEIYISIPAVVYFELCL
jgi:hypothetical protein